MAQCCNKCGSNNNCGCNDSVLHIPITCPAPQCTNYNDCPETFSDCCVIHNGDSYTFLNPQSVDSPEFTVYQNEKLCDTLQRLLIYTFCSNNPLAPAYGLKSNVITTTTINVSWYSLLNAVSYKVYIAPVPIMSVPPTFTLAGTVLANTTPNFTFTGLLPNTSYYVYVVTVYADDEESCPSVSLILTTKAI